MTYLFDGNGASTTQVSFTICTPSVWGTASAALESNRRQDLLKKMYSSFYYSYFHERFLGGLCSNSRAVTWTYIVTQQSSLSSTYRKSGGASPDWPGCGTFMFITFPCPAYLFMADDRRGGKWWGVITALTAITGLKTKDERGVNECCNDQGKTVEVLQEN